MNRAIEQLNADVIDRAILENTQVFNKFINEVLAKAIRSGSAGKVSRASIKKAIQNFKIPKRGVLKQVYIMMLLSDIESVIKDKKLARKERAAYGAAAAILFLFPASKPMRITRKLNLYATAHVTRNTSKISKKERIVYRQVDRYYKENREFIKKTKAQVTKDFTKIEREIKSNLSKIVFKDMKKEIRSTITEVVNKNGQDVTVKRPQTFQEIRSKLQSKFSKQVGYRVRRIVDTEMHRLAESVKLARNASRGFTHKTWNTEGDKTVRHTHRAINGKTIPIDSLFKVGRGKGAFPSDPQLPPEEGINCRCTLTYSRK